MAGGAVTGGGTTYNASTSLLSQQQKNPEEIDIDSDSDEGPTVATPAAGAGAAEAASAAGESEIPLAFDEGTQGDAGASVGGALADGAPESGDEQEKQGGQQQQKMGDDLDDPMFGKVNTAEFPYYSS